MAAVTSFILVLPPTVETDRVACPPAFYINRYNVKKYKYPHNYRRRYSYKDIPGDGCDIEGGFGK